MFQPQQIIPKADLQNVILNKTSEKTEIPKDIVEAVTNFVFSEARKAFHTSNHVEISGFGKYIIVKKRLNKRIQDLERRIPFLQSKIDKYPNKTDYLAERIEETKEDIQFLKTKQYELLSNMGGMEKQPVSERGNEGVSTEALGIQTENMQGMP